MSVTSSSFSFIIPVSQAYQVNKQTPVASSTAPSTAVGSAVFGEDVIGWKGDAESAAAFESEASSEASAASTQQADWSEFLETWGSDDENGNLKRALDVAQSNPHTKYKSDTITYDIGSDIPDWVTKNDDTSEIYVYGDRLEKIQQHRQYISGNIATGDEIGSHWNWVYQAIDSYRTILHFVKSEMYFEQTVIDSPFPKNQTFFSVVYKTDELNLARPHLDWAISVLTEEVNGFMIQRAKEADLTCTAPSFCPMDSEGSFTQSNPLVDLLVQLENTMAVAWRGKNYPGKIYEYMLRGDVDNEGSVVIMYTPPPSGTKNEAFAALMDVIGTSTAVVAVVAQLFDFVVLSYSTAYSNFTQPNVLRSAEGRVDFSEKFVDYFENLLKKFIDPWVKIYTGYDYTASVAEGPPHEAVLSV